MLTPDQLNQINQHLRKENWLINEDLIAELTDHYAAGIDERMAHELSFTDALCAVHTDFGGRKGLLKMEEEAQKQQAKKYYRQEWELIRSFVQGPRWFMAAGLLTGMFLLNVVFGQYDQLKLIYNFGFGFVGSAIVGHVLAQPILAFQHLRAGSSLQSTSSPVFISLYVLTAGLLLINKYVLPAYNLTLPTDLIIVLVTIIETLSLVYLLASLVLIRRLIRNERNRRTLKSA
ncbi:hypothetical protein [uncultured Spirosoma sp.]|uniref:hypothetical protein n=1 Tax=uncultured Spirosoma sp. TaxID=278208 RepID=UPI002590E865|nr:hypothetical protein [uncultured Spirosoma sp.]